jgi:cysteinyl-tRNA synthetase
MKVGEYGFESPWGKGRPGWHIECSTMSSDILGDEFDIHGGGIDLIFPHHENEIAQSEGAGKKFARYWVHNGLLTINGEKMAKSLGNFISIQDFIKEFKDADYLKLLFLNTHYRHPVDYTAEKIKEMKAQKERFGILFKKLHRKFGNKKLPNGSIGNIEKFRREFEDAMDDDFNTPLALGTLFNMVSECNKILSDEKDDRIFMLQHVKEAIVELSGIFGLSFENIEEEKSDMWITAAIAERDRLRKEKKFKEADEIRKMLDQKGIIIEDTKDNTTWRRKL